MVTTRIRASTVVAALVLSAVNACSKSGPAAPSVPAAPVTVAVTSPNAVVLFGKTETVTAVASDGRPPTGTWSSSDGSVATVTLGASTTIVTPAGAGQVTITFTASGGATSAKSLRMLPDLSGYLAGCSRVESCVSRSSGSFGTACPPSDPGTRKYDFNLTQSDAAVTGLAHFQGWPYQVSGSIGLDGTLALSGTVTQNTGTTFRADTTWQLIAQRPGTLGGTIESTSTETSVNDPRSSRATTIKTSIQSFGRAVVVCNPFDL